MGRLVKKRCGRWTGESAGGGQGHDPLRGSCVPGGGAPGRASGGRGDLIPEAHAGGLMVDEGLNLTGPVQWIGPVGWGPSPISLLWTKYLTIF